MPKRSLNDFSNEELAHLVEEVNNVLRNVNAGSSAALLVLATAHFNAVTNVAKYMKMTDAQIRRDILKSYDMYLADSPNARLPTEH